MKRVLNLSASGLSHLTKVTQNVPFEVGEMIGAAPKSGRPKWTALAEHFLAGKLTIDDAIDLLQAVEPSVSSDDRLETLLKAAAKRGARQKDGVGEISPIDGVTIKSGSGSLTLSVRKTGSNADFAEWLDKNLTKIIKQSHAEFTAVNNKQNN
ncbi:hypothetical protein HW561_22785 [Rhodobacteraceae bacterium B1Z28]|uniref:Uncharacterized protein n=1 Tax=Ruegeria haliotis TaxID=2747601 RepID=A0ABX2PZV1_9RHOB|nr:hypothetical protein [Ruegeria haliotis]NVO58607.1 hypothetical protein [Ruegeria haliotis]